MHIYEKLNIVCEFKAQDLAKVSNRFAEIYLCYICPFVRPHIVICIEKLKFWTPIS